MMKDGIDLFKKIFTAVTALAMLSGCSTQLSESPAMQPSVQLSDTASVTEETSFVQFPKGVSTYSKGKLKYTDSSFSVIFSDEFYITDNSYKPQNGIYLHNDNGTAALLIENVSDNPVTNEELLYYLYETYPYSEISAADNGDIVSWYIVTDKKGHEIITFQRMQATGNGYRQIVLSCLPDDKEHYRKIFDTIFFS